MDNTYSAQWIKRKAIVFCAAAIAAVTCLIVFNAETAHADSLKYKIVTKTELTARQKADVKAKSVAVFAVNKKITANKLISKSWYRFKYKGKYAYIPKKGTKLRLTIKKYSKPLKVKTTYDVNVRTSYKVDSDKVTLLKKGKTISARGLYKVKANDKWYSFKLKKKTVYVCAKYTVKVKKAAAPAQNSTPASSNDQAANNNTTSPNVSAAATYKQQLAAEGFPESYHSKLAYLHELHPKWVFKAKVASYKWSTLNKAARVVGRNCVDSTVSKKWRSKASSVYNSKTGSWTTFDGGRWYQATNAVIAYYLDPRNFLNTNSIYQFMDHRYIADSQTKAMLKKLVSAVSYSFLNTTSYVNTIYTAGQSGKVNPNVLAAMIIEEQGWRGGSGLISGNVSGYKGYYNFFNIGAYTAGGMTAVQRGLWYAKGSGTGATSYGRPWNSKYKAIRGGAMFYYETYIKNNQINYYSKKFNVFNGSSKIGTHEYMTNVMGAEEEGAIVKRAYKGAENRKIVFYIPVYKDMPAKPCAKPAT